MIKLAASEFASAQPSLMAAPESVLAPMEFTIATGAHRCGYNGEHRLEMGMARLTVREHDTEHHYCMECARMILSDGMMQLQSLLSGAKRLEGG